MNQRKQHGPRLGVSALVRDDAGSILLVQRNKPPFKGMWAFPGGAVAFGESLTNAVAREILEETGLETEVGSLIDTAEILPADPDAAHFVLVVFGARWIGGALQAGDDAADARWFDCHRLASVALTDDTARILASQGMHPGEST